MRARPSSVPSVRLHRGVTLIELMVVVTIATLLMGLAGPSFRSLVARYRVSHAASAIVESVWFARSEALKRNTSIAFTVNAAGWWVTPAGDASRPLMRQDELTTVSIEPKSGSTGEVLANEYGRLARSQTFELSSHGIAASVRCLTVSASGRSTHREGAC